MDANGLRAWMLANAEDWHFDPAEGDGVVYDRARRCLQLASRRALPASRIPNRTAALNHVERIPQARDQYGTYAYWDAAAGAVMATGAVPDGSAVPIFLPADGNAPSDLVLGHDGVLYLAINGDIVLLDLRNRWETLTLDAAGFEAWRLAADPDGGVWVLDRVHRQLARLTGTPLPRFVRLDRGDHFQPCAPNPDPPQLGIFEDDWLAPGEVTIALACSPCGEVAVLTWLPDATALLHFYAEGRWSPPSPLDGALYPYSLAWLDRDHIAVLQVDPANEIFVYPARRGGETAAPVGDFYPLTQQTGGPFLHGIEAPPHYPTVTGTLPVQRLSLRRYVRAGAATNNVPLDSGDYTTVWHRLYVEASVPAECGLLIWLAASDDEDPSRVPADDWYPHAVGDRFAPARRLPRAAWLRDASEIPFYPGLLDCPRRPNRAGLFTVLIQRSSRKVTDLRGRYLHVRVELVGSGMATPELFALRAYAPRFSYVDNYLPALYREELTGTAADARVDDDENSSRADFSARFLYLFESVLTDLEDRIAQSYLLTDPQTTPDRALEWLGSWIGLGFDPAYPADKRRHLLKHATQLYKQRGTLAGLNQALEIASGGAVSRGHVLVVEDFRLRRTFATILGADLIDAENPLLPGLIRSGNSYVGDTLFLGDGSDAAAVSPGPRLTALGADTKPAAADPTWEAAIQRLADDEKTRARILALYDANVLTEADEAGVRAFLDDLAHKVTVLVQDTLDPETVRLIRRIVAVECPAHVLARVELIDGPLLVGVAALVGVNTMLRDELPQSAVRLDESQVGVRDVIHRTLSLDPRLEGGQPAVTRQIPPTAVPPESFTVEVGATFVLDAGRSVAAPGRRILRYIWTYLGPL